MTTVRAMTTTTTIIIISFFLPPRVRVRLPIAETPRRRDARPSRGPEGCRVTSSPRSRHARVHRPRARDGRDATPMTTRNGGCNIAQSIRSVVRVVGRSRRVAWGDGNGLRIFLWVTAASQRGSETE